MIGVVKVKACGLIVEYNPFHNGHLYHLLQSKNITGADCVIAVMSGSFLQRGEPAIIDKFHRAKAALTTGVDIVLELPYPYAVQSSNLFATGAVLTLSEIGVDSICFGSEHGEIESFTTGYDLFTNNKDSYNTTLDKYLKEGLSFPAASTKAYHEIGLSNGDIDLSQPNNILGFSYVKAIMDYQLSIQPYTIQRTSSNYHDTEIKNNIASATSIRKQLLEDEKNLLDVSNTLPTETVNQLQSYKDKGGIWHSWESYFSLLRFKVMTMSTEEIASIEGVDEGLEYRIKDTVLSANSMYEWFESIKTKRYTWTRLQRIFVHILTNTQKNEMNLIKQATTVPYIRLLGMNQTGQAYLNKIKKSLDKPIVTSYSRDQFPMLEMEERATNAYYSVLKPKQMQKLRKQEFKSPIIV
ncbi:nucleotidyltransferase [Ornithinibacillus halophilus]|uniref:tRNA(Met) cytidine acetate ligase n=1 Tax=Ornithinibacillus halophilus TaxID=930117 RepID=A0A1M5C2V4_9BACI|nr:nucleotidyltransferase [Ornithinibacillus halophilus]SHF49124.1 Predicted nucleotidyltransferase [Ornithinibacillus halophilus]